MAYLSILPIGAGLKLLIEDFRHGRPLTLCPALALFGGRPRYGPEIASTEPARHPGLICNSPRPTITAEPPTVTLVNVLPFITARA